MDLWRLWAYIYACGWQKVSFSLVPIPPSFLPPPSFSPLSTDLSQGLGVGAHVSQDNQDMFLTLVGQELCRGQRQSRRDDTLNPAQRGVNEG